MAQGCFPCQNYNLSYIFVQNKQTDFHKTVSAGFGWPVTEHNITYTVTEHVCTIDPVETNYLLQFSLGLVKKHSGVPHVIIYAGKQSNSSTGLLVIC